MDQNTCENTSLEEKSDMGSHKIDERYKTLFEQVNACAFLTTLDGQILEANQRSCDLLGYGWNEILRLSLRNIFPQNTDWCQLMDEVAAKGGLRIETENICKNGGYLPVEVSISLFSLKKKPVMFVLIWDISDRKKAENQLRESEKRYRGLFEFTTEGIAVLDARGNINDVNTKLCEMFDFKKEELVGKNLLNLDLLTARSMPVVVRQFEELLSNRSAQSYTTEIKNREGQILTIEISSFFLVKKENEVDNFVLIIRDVTSKCKAENNLARNHELLQTLMQNIPDSIYFKDEQNRFILVNKTKADHWDVSPEEMVGKTDYDFMPEEQARQSFEDDNNIMQTGQPIISKIEKITRNDGSFRWVSVTKIPRYNPEGDIIGTVGVSRDVTIQEQAKVELARSEDKYKNIFENSSFAIILTDENHRVVSWNRLAKNLLGMEDDDLLLRPVNSLYPDDEWNRIKAEYYKECDQPSLIETQIIRKDQNKIAVDLSVKLIKDKDGNVLGSTEILSDISLRKKTQNDLEKDHQLIQDLMNNIPDSIYFKDEQNRFILVNKTKADHWDVSPEEMVGKTDYDFLPNDQAQAAFDDDNKIMETGNPIIDKIEKIDGSDGLTRWFSVTKIPRYDKNGNIIGTMGISRNVTEWKRLKEMKNEHIG